MATSTRPLNRSGSKLQVLLDGHPIGIIWSTTVSGGGRGADAPKYRGWAWQSYTEGSWDGTNPVTKACALRLIVEAERKATEESKVLATRVYPDTLAGAKAMLREAGVTIRGDEKGEPDPVVHGVWLVRTAPRPVICYLAGYLDPWGEVREANDFEEVDED